MQGNGQMMQGVDLTDSCQEVFQYVRQTYFPDWDIDGEWRVVVGWYPFLLGGVSFDNKAIVISRDVVKIRVLLREILIHEIAHAVAGKAEGHGRRWVALMAKASKTAKQVGDNELADVISQEVHHLRMRDSRYKAIHDPVQRRIYKASVDPDEVRSAHDLRDSMRERVQPEFELDGDAYWQSLWGRDYDLDIFDTQILRKPGENRFV